MVVSLLPVTVGLSSSKRSLAPRAVSPRSQTPLSTPSLSSVVIATMHLKYALHSVAYRCLTHPSKGAMPAAAVHEAVPLVQKLPPVVGPPPEKATPTSGPVLAEKLMATGMPPPVAAAAASCREPILPVLHPRSHMYPDYASLPQEFEELAAQFIRCVCPSLVSSKPRSWSRY